jgi:hypothetical protein
MDTKRWNGALHDGSCLLTFSASTGLGDHLQCIVDHRHKSVMVFIATHLTPLLPDADQPSMDSEHLRAAFQAFERTAERPERVALLLELAEHLQLGEDVERSVIRQCRRCSWLQIPTAAEPHDQSSSPEDILLPKIRHILQTYQFRTGASSRVNALITEQLCPDRTAAHAFLDAWNSVAGRAAARARGIILAFFDYDTIGLLRGSHAPGAEEMLLLEHLSEDIKRLTDQPEYIKAVLRTQTLALLHVLNGMEHAPSLWQQDLLHLPSDDPQRVVYRKMITPALHERVVAGLTEQFGNSVTAEEAFQDFEQSGWSAMVERLCGVGLEEFRLQRILHTNIDVLTGDIPQRIETMVAQLRKASQETGVRVPLRMLLADPPGSKKRVNFGRRIWFGLPAIMKRRQQRRRKHRGIVRPPRTIPLLHDKEEIIDVPTPEDRLANRFGQGATLPTEDARHVIRSVATSGVLGFISREEWFDACDPRIVAYLQLIKFGHIEGAVNIGILQKQVQIYAAMLGIPSPSAQVVKVLFNAIAKPGRWNAGVGSSVDGIVLRKTPIRNARRLNEVWLIVPVQLKLLIVDSANQVLSKVCHVLLVLEQATERPIGCWVSAGFPGEREVCLAVYQAIWHPWIPDWPIRGIPRRICIPATFAPQGLASLYRAALWLMTSIEITNTKVWHGPREEGDADMVARMRIFGPDHIRRRFHADRVTSVQAQEGLLDYLRHDEPAFPLHWVPKLDAKLWDIGFGMPGYATPAAGWLLPETGLVSTMEGGVVFDQMRYVGQGISLNPGQVLKRRAFPYVFPHQRPGFFVEDQAGSLYYVQPEHSRNSV